MPSPTPPSPTHPESFAESASEVVHVAEELVARAVVDAERSLAGRLGQRGLRVTLFVLRLIWMLAVVAYFAFGLAVLVTRYLVLPHIDDWRTYIESAASAALHAPVSVGRIAADWQGLNPRILLWDVVLRGADGGTVLALPQVDLVLSWTTLLAGQPRMDSLTVRTPEIGVKRLRDHRFAIAGIIVDPQAAQTDTTFIDWVLAQQHISVRDARVHFVDELGSTPASDPDAAAGQSAEGKAGSLAGAAVPQAAATAVQQIDFTDVNFLLTRSLTGHHFALRLRPPSQLAGLVDLRGQFQHSWTEPTARMTSWSGKVFAQFDFADLARVNTLAHLLPEPARLDQAKGALRVWIDFSAARITRLRADVALTGVAAQLRPDLQPLKLDSMQARITQTVWNDGDSDFEDVSLTGLRLDGPEKLHLPETDLLLRTARSRRPSDAAMPEQSQLEASHIVLSDWSRLAEQIPLPAEWLSMIQRTAARGTIDDLRAAWDGPAKPARVYSLHARFTGLGFSLGGTAPTPAAEGSGSADGSSTPPARPYEFENLAGTVDLNQNSGSLRVDTSKVRARIPVVFDEALAFDTFSTRIRWSRDQDNHVMIDVDSLAAANEDLGLNFSGSYRSAGAEPARLDVNGRLARGKVNAVQHYLPRFTDPATASWLRGALLDGRITEGSFYARGDPKQFPFSDARSGDFHAAVHVQDGTIDVAPSRPEPPNAAPDSSRHPVWPLLSGIDADVVFDRNRLTVSGHRAKAYGYDLSNVTARVAQLDRPDQHLLVDGQGSGPLAEIIHYIGASPVNAWTGGWLGAVDASGPARLRMTLVIPLAHAADSTVAGTVNFERDDVVLRAGIAPFSELSGQLDFTQRGIRLSGVDAGFLGGEIRLSADTQADGTVLVQGNGSATPQGAKRQIELAALRRVLDHTRGTVRYSASLTVHEGSYGLRIDSDLVGLAADLPEPFRKTAGEALPLHLENVPVAGSSPVRDTLRATVGNALSIELHRVAGPNDTMSIERGAVSVGGHANLPDAGMLLFIDQAHLDLDRWQKLLGSAANAPAANASALPAGPEPGTRTGPITAAGTAGNPSDFQRMNFIAVHAGQLTVYGKSMTNVSLSARRDPDQSWYADIDSDQASGSVRWIEAQPPAPSRLSARLAKLTIPERDKQEVTELLDTPPTELPELDIVAEQFELGPGKLGRLEVLAQNVGGGHTDDWILQKLILSNPDGKLTGSGQWQRVSGSAARKMSVKFSLIYSDAGNLLGRFGFPGTIRNASGKLDGELSWRGAPFAIDYPSLAGNLHLDAEKGQFLKLNAGAARLLGVLSLQSLANHVTGDFRNEFSEGFAFDTLVASANIANGTLRTDDFIMKGLSAVVRADGRVDLAAETQNLEIVYIPEINASSAPLAYALLNPASWPIGLAAFVGNFLLKKPLSAAFTQVYTVTGSWSDPKVERVKSESSASNASSLP